MRNNLSLIDAKPASKSRTIWLNGITVVLSLAAIVGDVLDLAAATGIALPEDIAKYVLFGVGVANIFLRRQTFQPIA